MTHPVSRRPHPILKRDMSPFRSPTLPLPFSGSGTLFSPHVHFPPTPGMAATYPAHSPTTYDRKPIAVSPCVVQLPRRGARRLPSPPPERDHTDLQNSSTSGQERERRGRPRHRSRPGDQTPVGGCVKGSYFHPRAYEACKPEPDPYPTPLMPQLVQDLSPSDESDDPVVTPPGGGTAAAAALTAHPPSLDATAIALRLPGGGKPRRAQVVELPRSASSPSRSWSGG